MAKGPIRDVVWPKEHGSWSLALEPIALGLLAAPSHPGCLFAAALIAAFFARRPLRIAFLEARPERRRHARLALAVCVAVACVCALGAVALAGTAWLAWALPCILAGAVFLAFDFQQAGREGEAEVAGAFAFGWVPAVFGVLGGLGTAQAATLGGIMLARAVPTVLTVRAAVRARKSGARPSSWPALVAFVAAVALAWSVWRGDAPVAAWIAVAVLAVRSFLLVVWPRPVVRPTVLGIIEAVLGVAFVVVVGVAW